MADRWIAIVDDDPSVLKALARLLRSRAFHVRTFESARRFLAALDDFWPSCLILDLQMPEMTGIELQQHMRSNGIDIPVIIFTAHDDASARSRCEALRPVAFLSKPLQSDELFDAIGRAIDVSKPSPFPGRR